MTEDRGRVVALAGGPAERDALLERMLAADRARLRDRLARFAARRRVAARPATGPVAKRGEVLVLKRYGAVSLSRSAGHARGRASSWPSGKERFVARHAVVGPDGLVIYRSPLAFERGDAPYGSRANLVDERPSERGDPRSSPGPRGVDVEADPRRKLGRPRRRPGAPQVSRGPRRRRRVHDRKRAARRAGRSRAASRFADAPRRARPRRAGDPGRDPNAAASPQPPPRRRLQDARYSRGVPKRYSAQAGRVARGPRGVASAGEGVKRRRPRGRAAAAAADAPDAAAVSFRRGPRPASEVSLFRRDDARLS